MSRRGRWAAALLAFVLAGLLGWRARPGAVPPAMAPALAALPSKPGAAVAAAAASAAVQMAPPAVAPPAPPPGTVEVCGYGRVSPEAERAALVERLAAGSSRQRVAAALLREDADAAARIAAATDDPVAYQIALAACRRDVAFRRAVATQQAWLKTPAASGIAPSGLMRSGPVPHQCDSLRLERLEAMAPDDALPWLMRLSDARTRGDEAAVSQVLYQVAQHGQLRFKTRALSGVVAELVGEAPTPGETLALAAAAAKDQASAFDGSWVDVARSCRPGDLRDANRRQLCEQVVRQMPGQVSDMLGARLLGVLEDRLGLPHGPASLTREEGRRLMAVMGEQSTNWMAEPSCANSSRTGRLMVNLALQGELAYLRAQARARPAAAPR